MTDYQQKSRIFIAGDTHGSEANDLRKLTSHNFPEGKKLNKKDYVIVIGDFGFLWSNTVDASERYWMSWFRSKPWTTLFLGGNHDNYERLHNLKDFPLFGSKVGRVNESVYFLKTGHVYNIDGSKFFVFGGARSIDKARRKDRISWWAEEEPSYAEMNLGLQSLAEHDFKVDYILTHEAPAHLWPAILGPGKHHNDNEPYQLPEYLQMIDEKTSFKKHFFGHHHKDMELYEKWMLCYNNVHEILE